MGFEPARCHFCGSWKTWAVRLEPDAPVNLTCRDCGACGPDVKTAAEAYAAHRKVAPIPEWSTETPLQAGGYWFLPPGAPDYAYTYKYLAIGSDRSSHPRGRWYGPLPEPQHWQTPPLDGEA